MAAIDWHLELEKFTEEGWLASTDPDITQELLFVTTEDPPSRRKLLPNDRKLRLFGCACCRRIWHLFSNDWAKECVLVAEAYCDRLVGEAELKAAFLKAPESLLRLGGWHVERVAEAAGATGEARSTWALVAARDVSAPNGGMPEAELPRQMRRSFCPDRKDFDPVERAAQAALLRDVYGNPFRTTTVDPRWLSWNDGTVQRLAQSVYDNRQLPSGLFENSMLAILADALEDAGCDNPDVISHLRAGGEHVRGCWVVDLLLGKR
jgi:hypothetical protein